MSDRNFVYKSETERDAAFLALGKKVQQIHAAIQQLAADSLTLAQKQAMQYATYIKGSGAWGKDDAH